MDNAAIKDNFSDLSEFFSTLSKEKNENRKKLENTIAVLEDEKAPEDEPISVSEDTLEPQIIRSDLANLFKNLENALQETKEEPVISFEPEPEPEPEPKPEIIRGLSFDEQTRLDEFSKLMVSFNNATPKPVKKVEIIDTVDTVSEEEKLESFSNLMDSLNETKEEPVKEEEPVETVVDETEEEENIVHSVWAQIENPTKNKIVNVKEAPEVDYIQDAVDKITDIKSKNPRQVDVYQKPITDFESLQKEFITFKQRVVEQLSSLGGGGATRLNDMDDIDTSNREDGDSLIYNSSTNKYTFSSAANTPNFSNQLSLEDSIDGNLLMDGTDADGSDAGDDFLQESGVNSGRDFDHNVLQGLTSNIIPQASATYDLGSETKRFRNLYLESDTVDIGGALISSDGSGQITISADGVTLPTGSKDADGFELARTTGDTGQTFKIVKLFTQASGLSTAAASFKFNSELANKAVYTEAGHTFTLSNGDARTDAGADLFQF